MWSAGWSAPVGVVGRQIPYPVALALGALIYFVLAHLGLDFSTLQESASPIWPASGFALALLTLFGPRLFPVILLGAFAVNLPIGNVGTALSISLGNTGEALFGVWILRRFARFDSDLFPLARSAGITIAAILAAPVSAILGCTALAAAGALGDTDFTHVAFTWWTGDAIGILLVTPFLLYLDAELPSGRKIPWRLASWALLPILVAPAVTVPAFVDPLYDWTVFLALPVLAVGLRQYGPLTGGAIVLAVAALWLWGTARGLGPFAVADLNTSLLNMQIMLAAMAISTMILSEQRRSASPVPHGVFLLGALVAAIVFSSVLINQRGIDARHLATISNRIQGHIQDRIGIYANAMRGGASLYAAARSVDQLGWRRYVETLDIQRRYPGIRGLGVVLPVDKSNVSAFLHSLQRHGQKDFTIKAVPGQSAEAAPYTQYHVVVYIEPLAGNESVIGIDLASEPNRRAAALLARDTGNPVMTPRIALVQDSGKEPGFLIFMPMYRAPAGSTTAEMLRWYFQGWIYTPFIAREFFETAMTAESKEVRLRIYDAPTPDPAELVYDSGGDPSQPFAASRRTQLILFNRNLTLEWQESALFDRQNPIVPISLSAGILLFAGLLSALIATLMSQKDRAQNIADKVSFALAQSNERFELAVDCSRDVIWDHDILGNTTWVSPRLASMYGYDYDEVGSDCWRFWEQAAEPGEYQKFQHQYRELLSGTRDSIDTVLRHRHRRGNLMYIQTRCRPVFDENGKVVRVIGIDTDITVVKELENRLRAAISVMADGFSLFDADDRIVLYNDGFIDNGMRTAIGDPTGCTFEEIVRAFAYHDMPVPDGFDREAWIAQRMDRHRNPPKEPLEITWGDGRIMRVSESRTEDGGYVGIWTDITETKRLGQRLQDAIGALPDGFALFDAENRLVLCNQPFVTPLVRAHFGGQVEGRTYEELYRVYGERNLNLTGTALEDWLKNRIAQHRHASGEPYEIVTHDGTVYRVLERRTSEGGIVGTWTDVTALRQAQQRLNHAIESISEGFLLLDSEGRYVVFNSQLLKLYPKTAPFAKVGADFATALRKGAEAGEYPDIDTPEQIDAFVTEWSERFRDPAPFQGAAPLAGGGWVMVSHRPTADGGCVNVYTDITGLKQRESDLAAANINLERQAQALTILAEELKQANLAAQQANISKSQFLANMSHELRTPLNGILGFADIIRAEMFGKIQPTRYGEYIDDIHRSGEHLLNLINDILDLSKIEAGKMSLQVDAVETVVIVDHAMRLVTPLAASRQVRLLPPRIDSCPILHADERQLKQILLNLLSNAVKFTLDGGTVSLVIRDDGAAGAVITVTDTGIGMDAAEIKQALERFGQADSSAAKSTAGTGLGLPLVEGLVKLHGGTLVIDSEKGRGTTVTVRLPWRPELAR